MTVAVDTLIPRDRWSRPLIVPIGGGKPIPYVRVSTLAKTLDDMFGLMDWKVRQALHGVTLRPDLLALARSAHGDKETLNNVAKQAVDAAESSAAANTGTALHSWCELVDMNQATLDQVPDEQRADVTAYRTAVEKAGLIPVMAERFVVNDELQAAGTFDRVYVTRDGRMVVGDLKTGASAASYPCAVATQVAIYARSTIYSPDSGRASEPLPVDLKTGVLVHAPAGTGKASVYALDLEAGWLAAERGIWVREWRKAKPIRPWINN